MLIQECGDKKVVPEVAKSTVYDRFDALEGIAIHVQQLRCAKVRNRNVNCLKCATACTSGCISLVEGELVIDQEKCVGCGTCATVCPTCALEAQNPNDANLLNQCLAAREGETVTIACQLALEAAGSLVQAEKCAKVVCAGRVDESMLLAMAAEGVKEVHIACGKCENCEQKLGMSTAKVVASTANILLEAWNNDTQITFGANFPESLLAEGATPAAVEEAMNAHFATTRKCQPILTEEDVAAKREAALEADVAEKLGHKKPSAVARMHVMKNGTLPHFLPDRRERLLAALDDLGTPTASKINTRLWGMIVIDGFKCTSCQMCATFCPTAAITKFEDEDGTFGIYHFPGDCVKCRSCEDICKEDAIMILDDVPPAFVMNGKQHRYVMKPRKVKLGTPDQIKNTYQQYISTPIYER